MGHKFRSYDKFTVGRPMMKVDFEGLGPAYKSYMGAAVSMTYIFMVLFFLIHKLIILFEDSATSVTSTIVEHAISETEKFTWEDHLGEFFEAKFSIIVAVKELYKGLGL